ncbi:MAG: hypothetical protein HY791_02780 [Deltaproteobacteria bacterium]|nr:hypothetical protein [Deltaproteobacteria bacterium]
MAQWRFVPIRSRIPFPDRTANALPLPQPLRNGGLTLIPLELLLITLAFVLTPSTIRALAAARDGA